MTTIAIVGTVGVPARYGGFETLAENLVCYGSAHARSARLLVYCSSRGIGGRPMRYFDAELHYIPLPANGMGSIAYDCVSLLSAVRQRANTILLLGVSGAIAVPFVRAVSRARIITNIDGVEWRRAKWRGPARWFLHLSEWIAVRFSHVVIADNDAIAAHLKDRYERDSEVIAYGGDHALKACTLQVVLPPLPRSYTLAVCRIEPENNAAMILDAFASMPDHALVFVGNWASSPYSRTLRQQFDSAINLHLIGPIYDAGALHKLRAGASNYVHGHSAGGTNPSLVEIMHFGCPILAYDCAYNRSTTEDRAIYFHDAEELRTRIEALGEDNAPAVGSDMQEVAQRRYTWEIVGAKYFRLFDRNGRT